MPALTRRDILFFVWNAAVGLTVGAVVARWPDLAQAPVPPVLWLVVGMGIFEFGAAAVLRLGGPLVTYGIRIAGLAVSFAAYLLVSALTGAA